MKRAVTAALAAGALIARGEETSGWQELFNGKDLTGWSVLTGKGPGTGKIPPGYVEVNGGSIHMYADVPAGQKVEFGTLYHKIQEGDTGDIVMIDTSSLTWAHPQPDKATDGQGDPGMLPENGGVPIVTGKGKYIGRFPEADNLDDWTTVEAIVQADGSAVHKINGVVRARLALITGTDGKPLKSGKIGVQFEGAEILYRNIRVKELPEPLQTEAPYASMSTVKGFAPGEAEIDLTNPSNDPISLGMNLVGKDAGSFRIERSGSDLSPRVPMKEGTTTAQGMVEDDMDLKPGDRISYRVKFLPEGKAGRYSAGLQIGNEDSGTFVILQGVATDALEGENEAPLERIVHALGIPLDVGGSALKLGTDAPIIGASVAARQFRKAGKGPVRMTPVARYSPPGAYPFGWQSGGAEQVAGTLADSSRVADAHQCLFPPMAEGGKFVEFSPGDESFGLFVRAGKHTVGTDKTQHPSKLANPARVYPITVFQGRGVRDAFLIGFEEASNGDYQDSVFLLENVRIAKGE